MNVREPQNNSSRVEREILEILEKAEASVTPIDKFSSSLRRRPQLVRPNLPAGVTSRLAPETIKIAAALVLAVLTATLSRPSHLLGVGLAIASAVVLLSLWIPSRSSSISDRPRWRGRDLGDNPRLSGWNGGNYRPPNGPKQPRR